MARPSTPPLQRPNDPERLLPLVGQIVDRVNLLAGIRNGIDLTLTHSATSTTLTDSRIGPFSVILLMPTTASAATALASVYIVCGQGSAVIHHASAAATDQTFVALIVG